MFHAQPGMYDEEIRRIRVAWVQGPKVYSERAGVERGTAPSRFAFGGWGNPRKDLTGGRE